MREHSAFFRFALIVSALLGLIASIDGCAPDGTLKDKWWEFQQDPAPASGSPGTAAPNTPAKAKGPALSLSAVDLSDAVKPVVQTGPVALAAAKNEWTSFVLQVGPRTPGATYAIRVGELKNAAADAASVPRANVAVAQVLSMPIDVNRAGYVRHTGQDTDRGDLPRALLPMRMSDDGTVDLAGLRDASRPTDATAVAPAPEPALLWVDLRLPADAPAGEYTATCEALSNGQVVASVPVKLQVHDFALPVERHLQVVGRLKWEDLERLYPQQFEAVRARLVNRSEPAYGGAVKAIDSLISLAQRHRLSVIVPGLQPTVKWPPDAPPDITWEDYDSLVAPWLTGDAFEDKQPLGFWPLPAPEMIERFVRRSQLEYWSDAATHFDQNDWLNRAPVWIDKMTPGRANEAESAELSRLAAETLAIHQRVRAAVPLEMDQLRIPENPPAADEQGAEVKQLDPASTGRLLTAAPGLVFAPPMRFLPEAAQTPTQYLRSDMAAVVPYVGAGGDERDVRLWAWLAYLRQATLINFADALPSLTNPTEPADPNELIWFYPGEWFGLDEPVPTIQLKWLRRAQQDYEYLWLARERGDTAMRVNAVMMARLITKPVEIQPGQDPDPTYALMSGTTSQAAWNDAQRLLAEMITLHPPKQQKEVDPIREHAVQIETLRWAQPQERPLLIGRSTEWSLDPDEKQPWLRLKFGVDLYNASDAPQGDNLLGWRVVPRASGWQIETRPESAPDLSVYHVRRATVDARFDLSKINPAAQRPMQLTFTDGYKKIDSNLRVVVPVAASDRREGAAPNVDGRISADWHDEDLVQNGPLVRMLSRPSLQQQQLELATSAPSKVYTTWAAGHFYVAFDLAGINPAAAARARNFIDYQFRRAWGEDLCEILIQPISNDGLPGPTLHVVCKPNGSTWVERKNPAAPNGPASTWQDVQAGVLHSSTTDAERWQGEVKIPWKAIIAAAGDDNNKSKQPFQPPTLLRFNFVQHRTATGESASWAGPVDFGRDDRLMGVLYLRDPLERGPRNLVGGNDDNNPSAPAER